MQFLLSSLVLLGATGSVSLTNAASSSHFYKRYSDYPEYCTTPNQHAQRAIPPLSSNTPLTSGGSSFKLMHASVVLRHGARTPWRMHQCWKGYDPQWDCDLMTLTSTPSPAAIAMAHILSDSHNSSSPVEQSLTHLSGTGARFAFEKRYDAAHSPSDSDHFPMERRNYLGGTCQLGQLILAGYDQSYTNGQILKAAYVNDPDSSQFLGGTGPSAKDPDYVLFDLDEAEDGTLVEGERAYQDPKLYFRSDDDQRTLMSGQAAIRGMFEELLERHVFKEAATSGLLVADTPVVRVHLTDRGRDVLSPNYESCPILVDYENDAIMSEQYQAKFVDSEEAKQLEAFMLMELDGLYMENPDEAMDCLMSSICTDRDLHWALDDWDSPTNSDIENKYKSEEEGKGEMFRRIMDMATQKVSYVHRYNKEKYAKLASSPIWNEILSDLLPFTDADEDEMEKAWPDLRPRSKMSLYSAHDSTLMAMLASLGTDAWDGKTWPAYASMLNIELYNIVEMGEDVPDDISSRFPTGSAVRIIFNGEVITGKVTGCLDDEELCDIDEIILKEYGESKPDEWRNECWSKEENIEDYDDDSELITPVDPVNDVTKLGSKRRITFGGVIMYILSATICAGFGAYMMYLKMGGNPDPRRMFAVRGHEDMNSLQMVATSSPHEENDSGRVYGMGAQSTSPIS